MDIVRQDLAKARDCYANLAVLLSEMRKILNDIAYMGSLDYSQIDIFLTRCIEKRAFARKGIIIWWDSVREIFRYTNKKNDGKRAHLPLN